MNIVVVDSGYIEEDAYFPSIDMKKYGWIQYPFSEPEQTPERCWRCDVIVSAKTPIDKAFKLKLIVAAGENYDHIDLETASQRGILVCNTPGLDPDDKTQATQLMRQVVHTINKFIKQRPLQPVNG